MNLLLLQPNDVLFFRDGRPMSGSLAGHGAAWPLPTVINAALHAALHRAQLEGVHGHDHRKRNGECITDRRQFGSLLTVGPFPVLESGDWMFPRPLDAGKPGTTQVTFHPLAACAEGTACKWDEFSSLPKPLSYAVANEEVPSKETPAGWWNREAWNAYLGQPFQTESVAFLRDQAFCDTEFSYGIGMNPDTGTQDGERFYSAHYLRVKPGCRLGLLAEALDKINNDSSNKRDLIELVFPNSGSRTPIIVGGQQRACTVQRNGVDTIPLPHGMVNGFASAGAGGKHLVKWVLLTPAIFPQIEEGVSRRGTQRKAHPGGWLPTWICPETGRVLLQTISEEERRLRRSLNAAGKGYDSKPDIDARLVAAMVGKPVPVTGYALPNEQADDLKGGAKPTHLAVPAGSVYYFETSEPEKLAAVLNWHGADTASVDIRNRRSTIFGEKGFGIGVCGSWQFHHGKRPS